MDWRFELGCGRAMASRENADGRANAGTVPRSADRRAPRRGGKVGAPTPEEIAGPAAFPASALATFVGCEVLNVSGGTGPVQLILRAMVCIGLVFVLATGYGMPAAARPGQE